MFHVVALLVVHVALKFQASASICRYSGMAFMTGIVLFCGSLYVLALTQISLLGWITPFGGLAFLVGWGLLFRAAVDR